MLENGNKSCTHNPTYVVRAILVRAIRVVDCSCLDQPAVNAELDAHLNGAFGGSEPLINLFHLSRRGLRSHAHYGRRPLIMSVGRHRRRFRPNYQCLQYVRCWESSGGMAARSLPPQHILPGGGVRITLICTVQYHSNISSVLLEADNSFIQHPPAEVLAAVYHLLSTSLTPTTAHRYNTTVFPSGLHVVGGATHLTTTTLMEIPLLLLKFQLLLFITISFSRQ